MFYTCYLYFLGSQVLANIKNNANYDPTLFFSPNVVSKQYSRGRDKKQNQTDLPGLNICRLMFRVRAEASAPLLPINPINPINRFPHQPYCRTR
jgi:hypothetical protein